MRASEYRLSKKKDFENALRSGRHFFNQYLILKIQPNRLAVTRLGLIASAKVDKRAVVRNRLRRQLKIVFEQNLGAITKGWDAVLIVKKPLVGQRFALIEQSFKDLLKRAKLLQ